jgi:hypothetical protein
VTARDSVPCLHCASVLDTLTLFYQHEQRLVPCNFSTSVCRCYSSTRQQSGSCGLCFCSLTRVTASRVIRSGWHTTSHLQLCSAAVNDFVTDERFSCSCIYTLCMSTNVVCLWSCCFVLRALVSPVVDSLEVLACWLTYYHCYTSQTKFPRSQFLLTSCYSHRAL